MKKFILFTVLLSAWVLTASAAPAADQKSVQVTGIEVVRTGESVTISFTLHTGTKVTQNSRSLIINPILRSSGGQTELPAIVIRGSRANVSDVRQAMTAAQMNQTEMPYYTANGKALDYMVTIPFQNWMRGSELLFNGINAGKGKATEVNIGLVADNLLYNTEPGVDRPVTEIRREPVSQPQTTTQAPVTQQQPTAQYQQQQQQQTSSPTAQRVETRTRTTGDELAARFSFVEPVSAFERARRTTEEFLFDYNMPLTLGTGASQKQNEVERFIGMTRSGALSILFRQGSKVIMRELDNNNRMLVDLISTIRAIETSPDTRIARVIIVGFSSPEGTLNENEKLSMERANVARDFLTANSSIRTDLISIYNGSVDWATLREQVSNSNMPDKYKILDIIDNTPVWDASRNRGRLGELMALNGGDPYRYMLQHFFPQLRQLGAYVKVYYENVR